MMTLQEEQPAGVTSECSSYDKVFLGTLEAQDSPSTSTIASIEQQKNRTKVTIENKSQQTPVTHMVPLTCKIDTGA